MNTKKIITIIAIIITVIMSLVVISNIVVATSPVVSPIKQYKGHKDELQTMVNTPVNSKEAALQRYDELKMIYTDIKLWSFVGSSDAEETKLFRQASTDLLQKFQQYNINGSQQTDLQNWITSSGDIILKVDINSTDLQNMLNNPTNDANELKKRYDILSRWASDLDSRTTAELQLFRKATKGVLEQYEKNKLDDYSQNRMRIWVNESENKIINRGAQLEEINPGVSTTPGTPINTEKATYYLSHGTSFMYSGFNNDNPSGYVVPTTLTINGRPYSLYCADHGSQPGSRLRTRNIRQWEEGTSKVYHPRCGAYSDGRQDTTTTYYDPPSMSITRTYDITGADNQYQNVGYILGNLGKKPGDPASWKGQQAIWMTSINRGFGGIENATDDFESNPSAITKSQIINKLSSEETTLVEQTAIDVQNSIDQNEVLRHLKSLEQHYRNEMATAQTTELRSFYDNLLNASDGLVGVINWIEKGNAATFSDLRANAYQFLMTIDPSTSTSNPSTNIHLKIQQEVARLSDELASISAGEGISLATSGALVSEANAYQDFYNELQKNNGELKVENKTGHTEVLIDRNTNTYTVGPFKVSYYDKAVKKSAVTGNRVDFAKITAIKIYDQNNNLYKTLSADQIDEKGNITAKGLQEFKITKTPMQLLVDDAYIFPKNNEQFYVQFTGDRGTSGTTVDPSSISLEVEFSYIAYYKAEIYRATGVQNSYRWIADQNSHTYDCGSDDCGGHTCRSIYYTFTKMDDVRIQEQIVVSESVPVIKQTSIKISPFKSPDGDDDDDDHPYKHYDEITMKVSGKVFWDQNGNKESLPNGELDPDEVLLKNIQVALYEYDEKTGQSTLATLAPSKPDANGKTEIRTNPTVTDANGYYIFEGVRPMNKYYVEFTYNGQIYQASTFTLQSGNLDDRTLKVVSNAKETQTEAERKVQTGITRTTYNARFASIGSTPHNYQSTNSLGYGVSGKTYTQKELMGYKLINKGNGSYGYEKDSSVVQLLDEVKDGQIIEGIISQKINEYIYGKDSSGKVGTQFAPAPNAQGKYPNLKDEIYSAIISEYSSSDPEIKDKLQYIEDIKMTSDTNQGSISNNLLSKYDQFTIGKKDCSFAKGQYYLVDTNGYRVDFVESMDTKREGKTTITYHSLYAEQDNINFATNERVETDIALREDVEKVTLEINGKSHLYEYNTRQGIDESGQIGDENTWEIGVRLSDAYYDTNYSRELYKSDYLYKSSNYGTVEQQNAYGKSKSDELEVFVTYKLTVRNQSLAVKTRIDEIVQYYDEDYEYIPERSYAEITRGTNSGRYTVAGTRGEQLKTTYNEANRLSNSRYASDTQMSIPGYEALYIQALDGMYLEPGQTAYVYVTFRVEKDHKDNEDWIKIDEFEDGSTPIGVGKENIVEINGYSTIYANGMQVPNVEESVERTPAGIVDRDSTPGNLESEDVPKDGEINYLGFEDDTDKAPNIRIILYRDHDREIEGTVWEDNRTEEEQTAFIADGIKQEGETPINGVTVQLVELMRNGTEHVWREYEKGSGTASTTAPIINKLGENGQPLVSNYDLGGNTAGRYAFKSFAPGTYIVRFIYGDTVRTVLVNSETTENASDVNTQKSKDIAKLVKDLFGEDGLNAKSYNGQDYKSTTYQEGIPEGGSYTIRQNSTYSGGQEQLGAEIRTVNSYDKTAANQNESGTYYYNIAESDKNPNVSDAKDIMADDNRNAPSSRPNATLNSRTDVINYSNLDMKNHIAEVLASYIERPSYQNIENKDNEVAVPYTAEEVKKLIEELINKTKMTAETGVMNIEFEYNTPYTGNQVVDNKLTYQINNVNLGLEERPKSQIEMEKEITNVKVTLSDKSVLFDTSDKATNALWQKHKYYDLGYTGKILDSKKFGSIENIRMRNSNKFGVVQLSMDEELMHGATIQITYKITAINVGETDYNDTRFYYTGKVSNIGTVVATTPNQIIDYVANNLQFYEKDNPGWKIISKEDLLKDSTPNTANSSLVNPRLQKQLDEYNTIITTESLGAGLVPTIYKQDKKLGEDRVSTSLVLTQLVSPENEQDDLSYRNIIEIVRTSNTVGRKNQYSVAGNQDPRNAPRELDSDMSETVAILPPFGAIPTNYILWISIGAILIAGVGFIIFKILKRK